MYKTTLINTSLGSLLNLVDQPGTVVQSPNKDQYRILETYPDVLMEYYPSEMVERIKENQVSKCPNCISHLNKMKELTETIEGESNGSGI